MSRAIRLPQKRLEFASSCSPFPGVATSHKVTKLPAVLRLPGKLWYTVT